MEELVRITLHLPTNTSEELAAYSMVVDHIKDIRQQFVGWRPWDLTYITFTGFTHTREDPPVMKGFWFSSRLNEWIPDFQVMLFIDYPGKLCEPDTFTETVLSIKRRVAELYEDATGELQEEVWCTVQQVFRIF